MTVSQLIDELKKVPQDAEVICGGMEGEHPCLRCEYEDDGKLFPAGVFRAGTVRLCEFPE